MSASGAGDSDAFTTQKTRLLKKIEEAKKLEEEKAKVQEMQKVFQKEFQLEVAKAREARTGEKREQIEEEQRRLELGKVCGPAPIPHPIIGLNQD